MTIIPTHAEEIGLCFHRGRGNRQDCFHYGCLVVRILSNGRLLIQNRDGFIKLLDPQQMRIIND